MSSVPTSYSPKRVAEIYIVSMDMAPCTPTPSAPVVTVEWIDGEPDPSPAAMKSGAAALSGTQVVQKLVGGVKGAGYRLLFQVDAPDGSLYIEEALIRVI